MSKDHNRSSLFVPPSTQDHIQGALSAAVALVMYGDYQSPQSADVYRLIQAIQQQPGVFSGGNDLCFIFRHFPQVQIHPYAQRAAEAAEAAAAQNQFWQMHDILFDHQSTLSNGYLVEYANNLKLNIPQFLHDLSKRVYLDRIHHHIQGGYQSGVTTAPALFINGIRYISRWNIQQLVEAISL
ncbi:DsbA family protein [Oculatella sp. LEGE 06141]|uniref:thioredoxin domain-containing protein n=1 Tax=Oculatella sp. LEGE 06141 TaxID=1828648 RepID=UPI001880FE6A|nr:DsbA family protein [Oculatella sp. LEGE 06141]